MQVIFLNNLDVRYHVRPNEARRWTLARGLYVRLDGMELVVPKGFWTDFASVPRRVWPIIDPYELGRAPVLHDFLYFIGYRGKRDYCDAAFEAGMAVEGVGWLNRRIAFNAVYWFGRGAWEDYRKQNRNYQLSLTNRRFEVAGWERNKEVEVA